MPAEDVTQATSVTTTAAEIWYCKSGCVEFDSADFTDEKDGIPLAAGVSVEIAANKTVYYRNTAADTVLVRYEK